MLLYLWTVNEYTIQYKYRIYSISTILSRVTIECAPRTSRYVRYHCLVQKRLATSRGQVVGRDESRLHLYDMIAEAFLNT